MDRSRDGRRWRAGAAVMAIAMVWATPVAGADVQAVQVRYEQAGNFTESRRTFESERQRDGWLAELARHIERQASRHLTGGQRLGITVTDIDRAGETEPWRGPRGADLRIVRDIYPPRIDLRFVLRDSTGAVLRQGERRLRDIDFMTRPGSLHDGDCLRYEKTLLDDWLDREFGPAA